MNELKFWQVSAGFWGGHKFLSIGLLEHPHDLQLASLGASDPSNKPSWKLQCLFMI